MNIEQKAVFVTGANRGIGQALVNEALRRGARSVYAGTRRPVHHPDQRVTPLTLDVTNASQIRQAVDQVDVLDVLINNAGIALYDDLSNFEIIERHLAVNLLGLLRVTHAFLPLLTRSRGSIVNNVSLAGLAPLPVIPSYSISKAAAFNVTQSLRALLAAQGVAVHAVILGPVDTDMNRGFDVRRPRPRMPRGVFATGWKEAKTTFFQTGVPVDRRCLARQRRQGARASVRSFHPTERSVKSRPNERGTQW
jgi:NAD(P)-dependent dehydrogenase (short-subunit alcohol dehydrogenase family)